MKCLKTGIRFTDGELVYAGDLYVSDNLQTTIVANKNGYVSDEFCENSIIDIVSQLAPNVDMVLFKFGKEYREFHNKWNFEIQAEILEQPLLLIFR